MELPGNIPPDRDSSYSYQQQTSNLNSLSGQHSSSSSSIGNTTSSSVAQQPFERLSRPMAFDKMECLVREMQDPDIGVPVRSQKLFLTSIPSAFMGYDLIEWMMERLTIEESEALSIANQLCLHGYFFPVNDSKTLVVKDDSSLYRFQTPYYWPWQHKAPDNVEYAIYLAKRSLRNKQRHGLEDYESESLASLHKNLKGKWDFITMQAEEQVKLSKDRKKGDKIVGDSQERAYWRVHRPPPGQFTPLEPCPVPSRDRQGKPRRRTAEDWQREVDYLKSSMGRTRMKMSQACECLTSYCETFSDYDFFIQPVLPSNPWVTEDITFWQLNNTIVENPTEKRVKRWSISIEELVSDPTGLQEFTAYLKKEYSHENIRFWIAVNDLRRSAHSQIPRKVKDIYEEFLEPGAPCEINIDGKTMEKVQQSLKSPCRFTFDAAAEHIYALLLKKDCYPRFVRSEHYKSLLATGIQPLHKKRFFGFGVPKKKSSTAPPITTNLTQMPGPSNVPTQGNLTRRRGSDRSLSGSAHELAVSGVKEGPIKVPHSHSQSNLSEIPYSVVIYRGDMPTACDLTLQTTMEDPSTATDDGVQDAHLNNKYQEVVTIDCLDSTPEVKNESCAVCPWDDPVETTAEEPPPSKITLPTVGLSQRIDFPCTNESSTSTSDINEVTERMRRSCGIRQSTVDFDQLGGKRLVPTATEARRASMTITPRLSSLQFSFRQQHQSADGGTILKTSSATSQSPTLILKSDIKPAEGSLSHMSLNLSKTMSFDNRDELYNLPTTISEEIIKICPKEQLDDTNLNKTKTIIEKSESNLVKSINESEIAINKSLNANVAVESTTKSIDVSPASFGATPIINVVCPIGEDDPKSMELEEEETKTIEEQTVRAANVEEPLEQQLEERETVDQFNLDVKPFDERLVSQEELSPTTEEYQECCPPDDYQYDISTEGEILSPGCVAPAPTPAPSIAPLAEVEIDPPDDETDNEQSAQIFSISSATDPQQQQKKKRKKREASVESTPIGEEPKPAQQQNDETQGRNAVCPWEDDDVSSTTDAPFVKTYSTLGYL